MGYDHGHLVPRVSIVFAKDAAVRSDYYTNIAPQDRYTNSVPWRKVRRSLSTQYSNNKSLCTA